MLSSLGVAPVVDNASMLVRAGLVTEEQLRQAYRDLRQHGGTLAEHLVAGGHVDEEVLCNFYRERLLVPRVGFKDLSRIPSRVIARVPADMAAEFRVIPLDFDREGNLLLAMADPADTHAVDEIAFFTGTFVVRAVAGPSAVAWALNHYHGVKTRLARPRVTAPIGVVDEQAEPSPRLSAATLRMPPVATPPSTPALPELVPPGERPTTPVPMEIRDQGSGVVITQKRVEILPRKKLPPAVIIDETDELPPPSSPDSEAAFLGAIPEEEEPNTWPDKAMPTPVPALRADEALTQALLQIRGATSSDSVAAILVEFLAKICRRAAFLVVRKGTLNGWIGKGIGVKEIQLRKASLRLDVSSSFQDVVRTRLPYRGPVADPPARDFLIRALGWAPEDMLAVPVSVREKVVGILYGDERMHALPDEHLSQLSRSASEAFERALQAMKITRSDVT
jgi:hypothetical protein